MATAISLITRAMRLATVIGKGETPDADESADGLAALNAMLDSWSTDRLFVYYIVEESLTFVAAQSTYTMGTGGDLNTTRPTKIEDSCFTRVAGIDTPMALIDSAAYQAITDKLVQSGTPQYLFPDMQYPLVRLIFYPTPSAANVAHIFSWRQLQQFAALTTALALPPGHERAIVFSLAEEFAPEFGMSVPPKVVEIANKARANIGRMNAPDLVLSSEVGYMNTRRNPGNILSG